MSATTSKTHENPEDGQRAGVDPNTVDEILAEPAGSASNGGKSSSHGTGWRESYLTN